MVQSSGAELELLQSVEEPIFVPVRSRLNVFWEIMRFAIVGIVNTVIDLLALNCLLILFPTHDPALLVAYNSVAYCVGALNSFVLNKYWTFHQRQKVTRVELLRFALVNLFGILANDVLLWFAAGIAHPLMINALIWANFSKVFAISGTATLSFIGMRLWVFAGKTRQGGKRRTTSMLTSDGQETSVSQLPGAISDPASVVTEQTEENAFLTISSLSVILPAHNEEAIIAETVRTIAATLTSWVPDFEIIVVNDGSADNTKAIVEEIIASDRRVRLVSHPVNQGYGAALVSGFEAVTKDLAFFTDSDGQFDIRDLARFFPLIEDYDAVLGYRINRQDRLIRKLNAWGWKMLVSFIFHIQVRDVDCAFKLYRAEFFRQSILETRGAMINTEILYKMKCLRYSYTQVGVHHLPRTSGRPTGAKLSVIIRAFRELFTFARKWHREEQAIKKLVSVQ